MNILSWSSTLMLGMLHALEPGHGKTYLAAVIMGKSWRWKQLLLLMGSLVSSHFLVLLILALGIRYTFEGLQDEHQIERISDYMPFLLFHLEHILYGNIIDCRKKITRQKTVLAVQIAHSRRILIPETQ